MQHHTTDNARLEIMVRESVLGVCCSGHDMGRVYWLVDESYVAETVCLISSLSFFLFSFSMLWMFLFLE